MEPSPETGRAAAEADRDLVALMQRLEKQLDDAKVMQEMSLKKGDIEEAKKAEDFMYRTNETIGMLRFNGYSSRFGRSSLVSPPKHDVRSDEGKFAGRGSQGHLMGALAKAQPYQPGASPYPGSQLVPSKKNPQVRRWQGQPKPAGGGVKIGVSTKPANWMQQKLVDAKPDRPLTGDASRPIAEVIPNAKHVGYDDVPNLHKLHAKMGMEPGPDTDYKEYKKARDHAFKTHGKEQDVPIKDLTYTQPRVNAARADEMPHGVDQRVQVARSGGKHYLMNGHHRAVSRHAAGDENLPAHVMDLDDDEPQQTGESEKQGEGMSKEEVLRHVSSFIMPFENTMQDLHSVVGDLGSIQGRLKDPQSLAEKLDRKKRPIEKITDVAGIRVETPDWESMDEAVDRIKQKFQVTEHEDYVNEDHPSGMGYRAHHMLVEKDGKPVEIQVRTKNQSKWAEWAHDILYKGEYRDSTVFKKYAKAMSDFIKSVDTGQQAQQPDCPEEIRRVELCLEGL